MDAVWLDTLWTCNCCILLSLADYLDDFFVQDVVRVLILSFSIVVARHDIVHCVLHGFYEVEILEATRRCGNIKCIFLILLLVGDNLGQEEAFNTRVTPKLIGYFQAFLLARKPFKEEISLVVKLLVLGRFRLDLQAELVCEAKIC